MTTYTTKTLILTLLTLWFGIFGVSPCYALTFSETQKLLASDGAENNHFGFSVSVSGDTAIIGARDPGWAYVYVRDGAGLWQEHQKLTANDGADGDWFGESVSISGDTAVIGARLDDDNGSNSGSAYVFVRDGAGVWYKQQKLTASDGEGGDWFGESVSVSGDIAVIGADHDDDKDRSSGSAYVFERDGAGVWREQQKLTASDGAQLDYFGSSVSVSGDTALIGAEGYVGETGWAYIFVRDAAGLWREQQKLTPSDGTGKFGWSVSLSGNTAIIGATRDHDKGSYAGSAYVFVRDGAGLWREQQKLTASDGADQDVFGESVSVAGDIAVIGALRDDDNGRDSGSVYVYVRDGAGVWHEQQKLTAMDGAMDDGFGFSVSISGDVVAIGAFGDDDNGIYSGSAYLFEADDPGNDPITIEKLINHRVRDIFGASAQLLAGTRYRVEYKVTNNSPNRLYPVQVFEDGQLVCNMYALDPGESKQRYSCATNQDVLTGSNNVPATVTAKVSGSSQVLANQTNAYYFGHINMPAELAVRHFVNDINADTQANAVTVNGNQVDVIFRVINTGDIELYRIKTYHDPASPVNSGWQEQCLIGTLMPGEVRFCKRTVSVTQAGLNKAFGRAQGVDTNVGTPGYVNAANPSYFNVVLP